LCIWLGVLSLARLGFAADPPLELRPHEKLLTVALVDLDRKPGLELAIASSRATGPETAERFVGLYRVVQSPDGTPASETLAEYPVPTDVVAFGVGDLLGVGSRSILYFTAQSVFQLDAKGKPLPVLRDLRSFFTMPSRDALPFWNAVVDLDGDDRDDLLLADPRGYAVYHQSASESGGSTLKRVGYLEVGSSYATEPLRRRRRTARDEGPIVMWRSLRELVPTDLNADRRIDLVAMKRERLLGFVQQADGTFASEPAIRHRLVSERGAPLGQVSAAPPPAIAQGDVDGDGRADYAVPELDLEDLSTRLRIFFAGPEGLPEAPSQIIKLSSLGTLPELVEVNGDGHLDLGITVFRSDRLLSLSAGEIRTLDFTYYAFLYDPAQRSFSRAPDLRFDASWTVPEGEESIDDQDSEQEPGFIRFSGDFDADGVNDALLFTADGDFSVYPVRVEGPDRRSIQVDSKPLLSQRVPPTESVRFGDVNGDGRTDTLFEYDDVLRVLVTP